MRTSSGSETRVLSSTVANFAIVVSQARVARQIPFSTAILPFYAQSRNPAKLDFDTTSVLVPGGQQVWMAVDEVDVLDGNSCIQPRTVSYALQVQDSSSDEC